MNSIKDKNFHIDSVKRYLKYIDEYRHRAQSEPNYDADGIGSNSIMLKHQSLASHYYLGYGDVEKFRQYMAEAAKFALSIVTRYTADQRILTKGLSAYYEEVCNALAGCDFVLAEELSRSLWEGKRIDEKRFKCKIMSFGCVLFGLMMNDNSILQEWLPQAYKLSEKPGFTAYAPHPFTVEGIWKKDVVMINKGLEHFAEMHSRFVKTDPMPYENFICIRGIALGNLAIHRGLNITIPDNKFFPKDLICAKSR